MRLLLITQKVDNRDPVLGFMLGWIEAFARRVSSVVVICLEAGECRLPENIRVLSLGKQNTIIHYSMFTIPLFRRLLYAFRFWRLIWRERGNYDAVFVHMNQVYVLLGGLFWRFLGKKVGLWYAHGHTPLSLRLAAPLCDVIFTSTKSGCRLASKKVRVVGQGIDMGKFYPAPEPRESAARKGALNLITVGRISPVKDYETILKTLETLRHRGLPFFLTIVGGPFGQSARASAERSPEREYLEKLKRFVAERGLSSAVSFLGPVLSEDVAALLRKADCFVSASQTGSLDKTFVEAMATGLPVVGSNDALREALLPLPQEEKGMLLYERGDSDELAKRLVMLFGKPAEERHALGQKLRGLALQNHELGRLVEKILTAYM